MKAAVIHEFGKPDVFRYEDVPTPAPGAGEVIIRVAACGINRYDLYLRMGSIYTDIAFPHVMGADVAGTIEAVGVGVEDFMVGEAVVAAPGYPLDPVDWDIKPENRASSFEVTGTYTWGGNAEFMCIPARWVIKDETGLDPIHVAAMPLVLMTAVNAVETLGEVKTGDMVLVQAGGSGSGNACIQLAAALGARVATTVGSDDKVAMAKQSGAELVINRKRDNFAEKVLDWTQGVGVDVVIDNVGGSVFEDNLKSLRLGGLFVNFGLVGGMEATLNFRHLFFRQHQLRGSFMGSMAGLKRGLNLLAEGKIKAFVDRTYPLSEVAAAHAFIDSRAVKGKVVLVP